MHRRQFLTSASIGTVGGLVGCFGPEFDGTDGSGPPRLTVDGRWVTDPDGGVVVLRGVSVVDPYWGTENEADRGRGYWETLELATDESAGWHANVLRIPIEPRSIRSIGLETMVEEYLDRAVALGAERGVYVLIDYHAIERYDTPSIDRRLRAFWDAVAPRYAAESHVLYEPFNEPTEPASGGRDAWQTWRTHAGRWLSSIRSHAPETPLVVGSPAWSSMARFAAEEPFEHENLLYSAHVYPSWEPQSWAEQFGTPTFDVPLFVTEWGYTAETDGASDHVRATTEAWGDPFRAWLDAHENVHWCAATFDARRQPAMFDDDWTLRGGANMGEQVREWLAERRTDHQPGGSTPVPTRPDEPPAPPSGVALEALDETRATIRWDVPDVPYADGTVQYQVAADGRDPQTVRGAVGTFEMNGLDPDTEYEVAITAVDRHGLVSDPASVQFTTTRREAAEAVLARADSAPGIDGWGEYDDAHAVAQPLWGFFPAEITTDWRALWDDDALYVRLDVVAPLEEIQDDVPYEGPAELLVQVYLDLDNSREAAYDGTTDMQVNVRRNGAVLAGPDSADVDPISAQTRGTETRWRTVLTVPWDDYDVVPISGHRLGMDVHAVLLVDDEQRGKASWYDTTDDAWIDPRTFAPVELGEDA